MDLYLKISKLQGGIEVGTGKESVLMSIYITIILLAISYLYNNTCLTIHFQ